MYSEAISFRPRTETDASQNITVCAKRNIIFAIGENIIP